MMNDRKCGLAVGKGEACREMKSGSERSEENAFKSY